MENRKMQSKTKWIKPEKIVFGNDSIISSANCTSGGSDANQCSSGGGAFSCTPGNQGLHCSGGSYPSSDCTGGGNPMLR